MVFLLDLYKSLLLVSLHVSLSNLLVKLTFAPGMLPCYVLAAPLSWWKLPGVWNKEFIIAGFLREGIAAIVLCTWHQQSTSGCSHFGPKLGRVTLHTPHPPANKAVLKYERNSIWFMALLRRAEFWDLFFTRHPCTSLLYLCIKDWGVHWGVQDFPLSILTRGETLYAKKNPNPEMNACYGIIRWAESENIAIIEKNACKNGNNLMVLF